MSGRSNDPFNLPSAPEVRVRIENAKRETRRRLTHRGLALPPRSLPDAMTDIMQKLAAGSGACTKDDLISSGFTESEIGLYREHAAKRAARDGLIFQLEA